MKRKITTRSKTSFKKVQSLGYDCLTPFYDIRTLMSLRQTCKNLNMLQIMSHGPDKRFIRPSETIFYRPTCFAIQVRAIEALNGVSYPYVSYDCHKEFPQKFEIAFKSTTYLYCKPWCHKSLFNSMEMLHSFPNVKVLHFQEKSNAITQLIKTIGVMMSSIYIVPTCHSLILINSPLTTRLILPNLTHFVCKLPWQQFVSSLQNMKSTNNLEIVIFYQSIDKLDPLEKSDLVYPNVRFVIWNNLIGLPLEHLTSLFPNAKFLTCRHFFKILQKSIDKFFKGEIPVHFQNLNDYWKDLFLSFKNKLTA